MDASASAAYNSQDYERFLFRSPLPPIEIRDDKLLHEYCLLEHLRERRGRPCVTEAETGAQFTYEELACMASSAARGFRGATRGLHKGQVLLLLLPNSIHFVVALLGACMAGVVVTPVNPASPADDVVAQCAATEAIAVITTSACLPKLRRLPPCVSKGIITVEGDTWAQLLSQKEKESDIEAISKSKSMNIDMDDTVALPFSSGTTGRPKGVMLTHRTLLTGVAQQVDGATPHWGLTQEDVVLCALPLFHIYALSTVLLCSLRVGAAVVLIPQLRRGGGVASGIILDSIHRHRITVVAMVPPMVRAVTVDAAEAAAALITVRMVMCGAAAAGPDLEQALQSCLPEGAVVGQGYGMTEAGPVVCMSRALARPAGPAKPGSCGCLVRNAVMKIVDPQSGRSLPRNSAGEICVRGNQIMKGYLNNLEATRQTIDENGWLHTGDIGYIDNDDDVFIIDRSKEIIKYKGFQVAPAELESLLLTHPHVLDAVVVPMKDEMAGELPVAFVVKKEGKGVTEQEIKEMVAKQVVYYKRLHHVFFTNHIPKTPSGKILRNYFKNYMSQGWGLSGFKDAKL